MNKKTLLTLLIGTTILALSSCSTIKTDKNDYKEYKIKNNYPKIIYYDGSDIK